MSVHTITFNHGEFIRRALDSALAQKTRFPIEIVVGEDRSTDRTRDIVRAYAEENGDKVRALLPERNLGRCGETNFLATLDACQGEYIAFLEGDDYWTDPRKLQIQADFLDASPDAVGCFHNAVVVNGAGRQISSEWFDEEKRARLGYKVRFDQRDCLRSLGSGYPSCSLMIRSIDMFYRFKLLYEVPEISERYADTLESMIRWRLIEIGKLAKRDQAKLTPGFLFDGYMFAGFSEYFRRVVGEQMCLRCNSWVSSLMRRDRADSHSNE